jgi:hypothetical protein
MVLGSLGHTEVARAASDLVGVTLELPLLNMMRFKGEPQSDNDLGEPLEHTGVRVGPWIDEADHGPQVLGLIGLTVSGESLRWGMRAGFAPTCLDGGDGGDGGKDVSWQVEPFLGHAFQSPGRVRPFVEAGPSLAHTCSGNTFDQGTALLFGLHACGGAEYQLSDRISLQLALRGLASWGKYVFYSHGETGQRWSASDLRLGAQLGLTFWF